MSPMFLNLDIGLKGYQPLQDHQSTPGAIHVQLEAVFKRPKCCPHCQGTELLGKGRYQRKVRHLDCFKESTRLIVHTNRFLCVSCGKSFIPQLPGILRGRHSSEPFREAVYQHHHDGICARTLARNRELGQATVARIYHQFTRRKAAERLSLDCPRYLGIDEHTLHKSQRFCTTFCDLKNRRVFDVQRGRSEADLAAFLRKLKGRERVRVICIDLSSSYRNLVRRYFPNARIVADRFHVVRVIQHHFMQLARLLAANLKSHRGNLAALRMAPERLDERQRSRLNKLFTAHPILKDLHEQMHQLRELMNHKHQTKRKCKEHIRELLSKIRSLRENVAAPLQVLANTLEDWQEPIACMWRFVRNNGITEGFHRKMKLIQRRAYGFRNFENYRLRVIAQCG
jgi:transposase